MTGTPDQISLSAGGSQAWSLNSGPSFATLPYLVLGSASGTTPGTTVSGLLLPLNVDNYTLFTLKKPNSGILSNTFNFLDANGQASASFNVPPISEPSLIGATFHHAYVVVELIPGVILHAVDTSNAVAVTFIP